ncbi:MAG: restriction endonuclease subunit S [Candidatus Enterosoma sp.]|nr:restriction endonuclease subunit S [Candidatus Enterosoma sp.]
METNRYKLGQLLSIRNGKDYKILKPGKIPVFGSGGIMTYVDGFLYDKESILLPRKGTLNNIIYVDYPFWTVDTMYWSIINADLCYPKFLYYYLSCLDLSSRYQGSTLPSMTFDVYYDIDVDLPEMEIQRKIGDLLNLFDKKIETNKKIIDTLSETARTIYDYWFLQFEFPNEEGKPYKSSGGKMVWNQTIKKEIPVFWKIRKIRDCIDHINTGLNPRDNFVLNNGNIRYITVKNITTTGTIDFAGCDTINEETKRLINRRSMVSKGDILFASIAPLGRCFLVEETPDDWEINESIFSIRPKSNMVSPEYLFMVFMSDSFVKKAEHSSTGSIFSGIRISTLEDMDIVVPDKNTMEKLSSVVAPIYLKKYFCSKENEKLHNERNYLLPLLISGQVQIG